LHVFFHMISFPVGLKYHKKYYFWLLEAWFYNTGKKTLKIDKPYKFRTRDHCLQIETGRYNNIPRQQRLCTTCNKGRSPYITVGCPIFPSIITKYLFTGSLKNRSIDNLETQKKYISMKNSQFFYYLLYAKSK
jgi:hypothetical protein